MQEHLQPGTLLQDGKYRIVRFIASGGFGCTYEGVHVLLNKRVAIKEFFVKDFCNRDETNGHVTLGTVSRKPLVEKLREKFIKEAQGLCQFNHPGIVNVSDIFEENGTAYFVMDYIDGCSLSEIVDKNGPMAEAEALEYIRQIADALRQVHSKHRLHLDIKAGNIMVDRHKHAVLIDFGASKQYDTLEGQNTSTLLGYTCGYAPPEQMSNSVKNFHACTDLYALGATLYKLVTGDTPPDSMTILSEGGLEVPGNVSPKVANAIKSSMQPVRSNRPQSVDEFLALLEDEEKPDSMPARPEPANEDTVVFSSQPKPKPKPEPEPKSKPQSKPKPEPKQKPQPEPKPESKPEPKPVRESVVETIKNPATRKIKPWMWGLIGGVVVVGIILGVIMAADTSSDVDEISTEEVLAAQTVNDVEYTNTRGETFQYTGEVVNGMPQGKGVGVYPNGKYEGDYSKGDRHGNGVFTLNSGTTMNGQFVNDNMSVGEVVFNDGSTYSGSVNPDGTFNSGTLEDKDSIYIYDNGKIKR